MRCFFVVVVCFVFVVVVVVVNSVFIFVQRSKNFEEIFLNIHKTNYATLVISIISIAVLFAVKMGVNDNKRYKKKFGVPIPIELILVRSHDHDIMKIT